MKLAAAFLVVAIHSSLIVDVTNEAACSTLEFLESLAVPVFFCVTGYFLEEKLSSNVETGLYQRWLKKYMILYGKLSLVYLPLTIYGVIEYFHQGSSALKIIAIVVKNYLLVGEQFYSWPLWYLLSSILGLFVLSILSPMSSKKLVLVSVSIFAISYFINTIPTFPLVRYTIGSGRIFTGISYFMIGMLVYRERVYLSKCIVLLVPVIAVISSFALDLHYSTTSVAAFISVPWIIGYAMHFYRESQNLLLAKVCRDMSSWIYYSHMYFLFCWQYLFPVQQKKGLECFIFVLFGSIIFSLVSYAFRTRRK